MVCEGRDQGTTVFPDAFCKFFLTAKPETRAQRRFIELQEKGITATLEEILDALSDDDIDVDHLAEQVKRATELVKICRDRIAAARLEVKEIQLPEDSR